MPVGKDEEMVVVAGDNLTRYYVPEVHDIHPGMEARLDALLDVWPHEAREHLSLLVVPNWQDRYPLEASPAFASRIAALAGHKVLHGWTHSLGPDLWNRLMYGHDNRSEFAKLDRNEAQRRVAAAIDSFAAHFGAAPSWFCAPRWQQSAAATEVLREAGLKGYMLNNALRLYSGENATIPALNFDEGPRKLKSALLRRFRNATIDRLFARGRPFRVTLHPDDVTDAATWRQATGVIKRLAEEGWTPVGPDEAVKIVQAPSISNDGKSATAR